MDIIDEAKGRTDIMVSNIVRSVPTFTVHIL